MKIAYEKSWTVILFQLKGHLAGNLMTQSLLMFNAKLILRNILM